MGFSAFSLLFFEKEFFIVYLLKELFACEGWILPPLVKRRIWGNGGFFNDGDFCYIWIAFKEIAVSFGA